MTFVIIAWECFAVWQFFVIAVASDFGRWGGGGGVGVELM